MTLLSKLMARNFDLPPARYAARVERDLRVPMDDGVILLADRYVPKGIDNPPLVLARGPYGRRRIWGMLFGRLLAERGFQAVMQSCRDTYGSGGVFDPFGGERADGLATVEWLRRQPWYPGSFGTVGPSYLGFTQWAIAHRFATGHRLRVQVSGGAFPRYPRNPGTGARLADTGNEMVVVNRAVHHDPEHPSALLLPVP